jgi:uncharacterized membrane protein
MPQGPYGPPGSPMMAGPTFHPLAITSLILGILSVPSCCCLFATPLLSLAGVVLGIVGIAKIRENPQAWKGHEMCVAGIVLSSVGIVFEILAFFTTWDDVIRARLGYHP